MSYPADHSGAALKESADRPDRIQTTIGNVLVWLKDRGYAVTRAEDPLPGSISSVRIEAYGPSASAVEATLLAYARRAGAATEATEVPHGSARTVPLLTSGKHVWSFGGCVIERNLDHDLGHIAAWRGRVAIRPGYTTALRGK